MAEYYRKDDVRKIVSDMLYVIEDQFFKQSIDSPETAPPYLKGYTLAVHRFMKRLNMIDEEKPLRTIDGDS